MNSSYGVCKLLVDPCFNSMLCPFVDFATPVTTIKIPSTCECFFPPFSLHETSINWNSTVKHFQYFSTITWPLWQKWRQPLQMWPSQHRSAYCLTYYFANEAYWGPLQQTHSRLWLFSPQKDNTIVSAVKEVSFFTVELWNLIKVTLLTFSGNIYPAINHTTCQRNAALQGTITTTHGFCCFSSRCTSTCISVQMYRRPLADHRHFHILPRCPLAVRLPVTWLERATEHTALLLRSFVLIKLSWHVALSLCYTVLELINETWYFVALLTKCTMHCLFMPAATNGKASTGVWRLNWHLQKHCWSLQWHCVCVCVSIQLCDTWWSKISIVGESVCVFLLRGSGVDHCDIK